MENKNTGNKFSANDSEISLEDIYDEIKLAREEIQYATSSSRLDRHKMKSLEDKLKLIWNEIRDLK